MGSASSDLKGKSKTSKDKDMPFFKRQSSDAKKNLEHKLYLARESPDPTFDICDCELSDVPSGVFSLCKVLQKESLLLSNNWLTSLKGGGLFKDLFALRILDLHCNELQVLPDEIKELKCLQVLNVESNKLKQLPTGIAQLNTLQTLNLKDNKFRELPDEIYKLRCLHMLDVSVNPLEVLPAELAEVRTLEMLIVTTDNMTHPPSDICSNGTEAMMKFLCKEHGILYEHPSKFLLDVLDSTKPLSHTHSRRSFQADVALSDSVMQYESRKEEKRQQRIRLEKQLEEEQRLQVYLANKVAEDKKHLLDSISLERNKIDGELAQIQSQKDQERNYLIQALYEVEQNSGKLLKEMLKMNEKARRTEELVEQMEQERIGAEQWFVVRQEEAQNLREKEVLAAMEDILKDSSDFQDKILEYITTRDEVAKTYHRSNSDEKLKLDSILDSHDKSRTLLTREISRQEHLQKEAFEALQLQKDAKTQRISSQIQIIEQELAQLTMVELEQREMRLDTQMNLLTERRQELMKILMQLMEEKDRRAEELRKRLEEMEEQKLGDQTDYWMIQYQRLMDRKPQSLFDMERQLEYSVIEILEKSDAADYITTFARHRITIETLCVMTDDDLKQMGIHEVGVRKAIQKMVEKFMRKQGEAAAEKTKQIETEDQGGCEGAAANASAPAPSEVVARGFNTECVVCMDCQSAVLFLNCGHVCTCFDCSRKVYECPMCRSEILQRIRLATS